jgi:hypothetical protein
MSRFFKPANDLGKRVAKVEVGGPGGAVLDQRLDDARKEVVNPLVRAESGSARRIYNLLGAPLKLTPSDRGTPANIPRWK